MITYTVWWQTQFEMELFLHECQDLQIHFIHDMTHAKTGTCEVAPVGSPGRAKFWNFHQNSFARYPDQPGLRNNVARNLFFLAFFPFLGASPFRHKIHDVYRFLFISLLALLALLLPFPFLQKGTRTLGYWPQAIAFQLIEHSIPSRVAPASSNTYVK